VITVTYAVDAATNAQAILLAAVSDSYAPSGYSFANVVNVGDTNPTIIYAPTTGNANTIVATAGTLAMIVIANM